MTQSGVRAVTAGDEPVRCGWCRRVVSRTAGRGRPKKFCSQKCRQWNWVAQQRAHELELSEHELIITRTELDSLHDDLYVLACAVEDTERDLAAFDAPPTATELQNLLDWLLDSARPLRNREISAPSAPAKALPVSSDQAGTDAPH
ncbi:MAG TPA: hypothetical protein VMM60_10940 [Ilumatobacter sp.]|nr:hypothetical protein [Ilumatobacter sp.]